MKKQLYLVLIGLCALPVCAQEGLPEDFGPRYDVLIT